MIGKIARYALLRAGKQWEDTSTTGLELTPDGVLTLARVPGSADGSMITLPGPYDLAASGLAVADCKYLYLADTVHHRIIALDEVCESRSILPAHATAGAGPGQFNAPRGLAISPSGDLLYMADSGNSRVQVFRLPTLELQAIWEGMFSRPIGIGVDSLGRVYVLDRGLKRLLRLDPTGSVDTGYTMSLAMAPGLTSPAYLAVATDDTLYVSDDSSDQVLHFNDSGQPLGQLTSPSAAVFRPRALAAYASRLFVVDAGSGSIWACDCMTDKYLGKVAGYQGPVTALAVGSDGTLYIKTDLAETVYAFDAGMFVPYGELLTAPLDAGDESDWVRVVVDAEIPHGTSVQLQMFATDDPLTVPFPTDWSACKSLNALVPPFAPPDSLQPGRRRYLWLRVSVATDDRGASPQIYQVQAETAGEDYLDYLPALYRREDAHEAFLQRWLALFRSQLGDLESLLDYMPQRFDPATAPKDHLDWLASWLAFELPLGWSETLQRELLLGAYELSRRRGTLYGVGEFVRIYTGVRPQLVEAFHERHIWLLDQSSYLGFDTGLAPIDAEGIVVPDSKLYAGASAGPDGMAVWSDPAGLVIGSDVVGQSGPLAAADFGESLFDETAHRFTALIPAACAPSPIQRQAIREMLDVEKPAHTDYHLCFVEPQMRIGVQSSVGIDSIIAGPSAPLVLEDAVLEIDSRLDDYTATSSRIGQGLRLGRDLVIQ